MPTQVTLRMEGDQKLRTGLNTWRNSFAPISRARQRAGMQRARQTAMSGYQKARPSAYVRTGNLDASTFVVEEGFSVRVISEAYHDGVPYSEFVVGRGDVLTAPYGQAAVHAGWWTPIRQAVDDEVEIMVNEIDSDIQASAEAAGL